MSRNLAGYLHVPGPSLKDVGFMLIPEFHNIFLARVGFLLFAPLTFSDFLSVLPFVLILILALRMDTKHLSQYISDQLRIFSIFYFVRAC